VKTRSWMFGLVACGGLSLLAAIAAAQATDDVSPTVLPARFSASQSPYAPSTMPLSSVPEGVTTYFWPEEPAAEKVAKASYAPASFAPTLHSSAPAKTMNVAQGLPSWPAPATAVQTTLRPVPATTVQYPAGSMQCVCTPTGQPVYNMPPANLAPTATYPPVYSYRPAMPVSAMPADYYFGRGLIGQPKVYVQGQPVRNALRFITP
jgi:hypothetical protein